MQPGEPHLSIDYGAVCTQAVVVWPGGRWEPLTFDGALVLSSAVHAGAHGETVVGEAAWRRAVTMPDGFVASPLASLTGPDGGTVAVSGVDVTVADLAAATLRHVAAVAATRVGAAVGDVRMVVPAGWGPRRRTWLRQSAYHAGLGQPRLVDAPVAAAQRLLAVGVQVPVGAFLLICDLGAGCEATVLRRGPAGFEVLSTLADPDAGTAAIDRRLFATLTGADDTAAGDSWAVMRSLQAAREALAQQAVVTVPMPGSEPAMVVQARVVDEVAEPVLKQAGALAARAVTAAELTADQLAGGYLIGGAAVMPAAAQVIGAQLGLPVQAVAQPGFAAVLGAADADAVAAGGSAGATPTSAAGAAVEVPPLRRLAGVGIPGLASLALYCHMVFTASFNNGTPRDQGYGYYVLASWGELTIAAVFALLSWLAAAPLLGITLAQAHRRDSPAPAAPVTDLARGAGGIVLAVAAGLAVCAMYAVAAGVYFGVPVSQPLRWALLPLLPTVVVAGGIAWLARRPRRVPRGWDTLLAFPISSVAFTTVGMVLLAIWWHGPIPAVLSGWIQLLGRAGGMLIGVGIACALVRHLGLRVLLGVFLALFGLIVGRGTGILAVSYAVAVTVWAAYRLWILMRSPTAAAHDR
jgi:hypothetical protein